MSFHELEGESESTELLEINVYYEALCPYSNKFIRKVLYPAMIINNWLEYTDLNFIPYGKAEIQNSTLVCQHGNKECKLNALLHACIVEHNYIEEQMKMIDCMMGTQE